MLETLDQTQPTMYGMPILMANRIGQEEDYIFWGRSRIISAEGKVLAEASEREEELLIADLDYRDVIATRAKLPTVRDSNLDLIHREIERLRNTIGYPKVFFR